MPGFRVGSFASCDMGGHLIFSMLRLFLQAMIMSDNFDRLFVDRVTEYYSTRSLK
jgi:hypothetical protein